MKKRILILSLVLCLVLSLFAFGAAAPKASAEPADFPIVPGTDGTFGDDPYSSIPEELVGTTVDVLWWREPDKTDREIFDAFEKKTGIKVNLIFTANNTAAYITKLVTMMSSGDSPDIVNMGAANFPQFAIAYFQPIDEGVFRLNDEIWDKATMDAYAINGKYYGICGAGTWYANDTDFVTYYKPSALATCGIETTPYEIWKANKNAWNTDKMVEIARKFKSKDDTLVGISYQSNTLANPYMLANGVDFVNFDGTEFSSNLVDERVLKSCEDLADWFSEGLITGWNSYGVGAGTVALFDAISYGMHADANWFTIPTTQLECVPVAGTHTPSNPKLWGIPKGAENVEAAVYLLRYLCDPEAFKDTSYGDIKNTFATEQMYEVFSYISNKNTPKAYNFTRGVLEHYDTSSFNTLVSKLSTTTSANIKTELDAFSATMKAACNRCNKNLMKVQTKPGYDTTASRPQYAPPENAPVLVDATENTITVQVVEGYEYFAEFVKMCDEMPHSVGVAVPRPMWKVDNVFECLPVGCEYNIYQRVAGTDTVAASDRSPVLVVRTTSRNGWYSFNNKWYFYDNGKIVKNSWMADSVGWVYVGADGAMLTNEWVRDSVGWCYVGDDGYCVTNCWKRDSVGWCYLDSNGRMVTNQWLRDSVGWCYIGADGYCVTNAWMKDSVGWVYLDSEGRMATNTWVQDSVGWCYVGDDGYAVTNCWKKDNTGWCYLDSNGSMTKNSWVQDGDKWYYLDNYGYMVCNYSIYYNGKVYYFDANGVCVNP